VVLLGGYSAESYKYACIRPNMLNMIINYTRSHGKYRFQNATLREK